MPDTAPPADGVAVTSSWLQTMVREQVVRTVTSSTRPTGVEGTVIYETDTDRVWIYSGSAWVLVSWASSTGRPGVVLTDTSQSIPNATATDITWGTEVSDVDGWTSGGSATLTVPAGWAGRYLITASGVWGGSQGTQNGVCILINGVYSFEVATLSVFSVPCVSALRTLAVSDTLKMQVYQSSGAAINFTGRLEIVLVGA